MKNKIIHYILLIYLFIQPFLDVIATTNLSKINIIMRGLFIVTAFIYLWINHKSTRKINIIIITSFIILLTFNVINSYSVAESISSIMKLYYLPIILLLFYNIKDTINEKYLLITLSIYILLFISSYIFGFGYDNYLPTDGKSGFRGVFNSINEISAIIIGLYPISLNYLKNNKKHILAILLTLSIFIISLLTGTKVLMIGFILILLLTYLKDISNWYKELSINLKIISILTIVILIIIGIYGLTFTRFYQNMLIQQDFFKVESFFSIDFINKIIFNDRLTFLKENIDYFLSQDILKQIFGIGYYNQFKLIEIDIFDIVIRYGYFGIITFLTTIILTVRKIKLSKIALFSSVFLILISLTSGHVILSPNVAIYFGYFILINKKI